MTPEQAARYQERFLPDAPAVDPETLRRHAARFGGYMVAETAHGHQVSSPVPPTDTPTKRRRHR